MLIVKCKMLTEAPRLKLVLFCRDVRPAVWGQGKLGPIPRLHPVTAAAWLLPILNMKQTISRSIILYRYPSYAWAQLVPCLKKFYLNLQNES